MVAPFHRTTELAEGRVGGCKYYWLNSKHYLLQTIALYSARIKRVVLPLSRA